jgi:AraC-like DNA-binding protein
MKIYREITGVKPEETFYVGNLKEAIFDYPLHNHPEYELHLVLNCAGKRIVGDSIEDYDGVDLVLVGPHVYHRWDDRDYDHFRHHAPETIFVQFAKDLFDHQLLSKKVFYPIRQMLVQSKRGIAFYGETLLSATEKMKALVNRQDFDAMIDFLRLLNELAGSSERRYLTSPAFHAKPAFEPSKRINAVYEYLLKHFREQIQLPEIAAKFNMSDSAFSHFFKKCASKSFTQYLVEMRLGYACRLLVETEDSISEIAYQSGFPNLSNFNRLFRKNKEITPMAYRKKYYYELGKIDERFLLK